MEFIIVTGLSGAGKSRAMHAMEDIGFYCIDNLPPKLIPSFYDLCLQAQPKLAHIAVVSDIRGGDMFSNLFETLEVLKKTNKPYKILFLDANDIVLRNRFQETRRKHPLSGNMGDIDGAVAMEREILRPVREVADYVIDTSLLTPAQLKRRIDNLFLDNGSNALNVHCISFGFKFGMPTEADLVFDVRCLPNPYYVDELKNLTGLDKEVRDYVMKWEQAKIFTNKLLDLIDYMLPLYGTEGKSQLVIAIGCTGGHHRSVTIAQLLYNHLIEKSYRASVSHRDVHKN